MRTIGHLHSLPARSFRDLHYAHRGRLRAIARRPSPAELPAAKTGHGPDFATALRENRPSPLVGARTVTLTRPEEMNRAASRPWRDGRAGGRESVAVSYRLIVPRRLGQAVKPPPDLREPLGENWGYPRGQGRGNLSKDEQFAMKRQVEADNDQTACYVRTALKLKGLGLAPQVGLEPTSLR
jgi:hypothetical protein